MAAIGNASFNNVLETSQRNMSTPAPEHCSSTDLSQPTATIHIFTLFASLIGNSLLITAFVRMKEKVLLAIASMAASDLLTAVFLLPRFITNEINGSGAFLIHGNGGTFLCKMCSFLGDTSLSVSTLSMVVIAIERFLAVVYPIQYKNTSRVRRRVFFALTWIMAAAFHSPYFYTHRLIRFFRNGHEIQICLPRWEPAFNNESAHYRYNIFLYTTVLILPLLAISVLYIIVALRLRKDKMSSCRSENGTRRIRRRTRTFLMMAISTTTAFLICWMLHIVLTSIRLISPWLVLECNKGYQTVSYISYVLASCYCAVNTWLCLLLIPQFQNELKLMMQKIQSRCYAKKSKRYGKKYIRSRKYEVKDVMHRFESCDQSIIHVGEDQETQT